jgi:hypothetical protein
MKFVPVAVTRTVGRSILKTQKVSPTLMFGAGLVGFGATVFLASRATLRLEEVLEEASEHIEVARNSVGKVTNTPKHPTYTLEDFASDKRLIHAHTSITVAKLYGPAIACGFVSVALLTGSHKVLNNRNAALTAAYVALEQGFNQYRDRVREELGEEKDRHFRFGSEAREFAVDDKKGTKVEVVNTVDISNNPSIYAKFFDQLNPNWKPNAEENLNFLAMHQKYANQRLHAKGHLFLNDVYRALGMDDTRAGAVTGWVDDGEGDCCVDFGIFDRQNQARIDFVNGREGAILLDFNVDGLILDKI